jgi:competence ComEA-like helix-hairpin-helix protein
MKDFFTKQEKIFISFLLFGIIVGAGIELYRSQVKTVTKTTKPEGIEDFERQIQEKAALINSLLDETELSPEINNFSNNYEKLTKRVNTGGKSSHQDLRLDINTATVKEIVQLPKIGPVIANRIVEYRNARGGFNSIEELINVKGIGEKRLEDIKPYIYIKHK